MSYDYARTKYVTSLDSARYVFQVLGIEGGVETTWKLPNGANPAFVAPVPADQHKDLQTFFFGPMSHSLTLRPIRPEVGCCASNAFKFEIATEVFGPAVGSGEISNGCCENEITVSLPSGQLKGVMSMPCLSLQPRTNLDWSSGENMSVRGPPFCVCPCLGPFRTGYVGTAPGEEDEHKIRYWSDDGMYIACLPELCTLYCKVLCAQACKCCECVDEVGYTTWHPQTLKAIRAKLLSEYSFVLNSSFGVPSFELNAENLQIGINNTENLSDVNALGHVRIRMKREMCCKFVSADSSDTSDTAKQTGFDLTFRGTFNQNQLDSRDFNLALAYLIMQSNNYQKMLKNGMIASTAAMYTLPKNMFLLHRADVLPNIAAIHGNKMV